MQVIYPFRKHPVTVGIAVETSFMEVAWSHRALRGVVGLHPALSPSLVFFTNDYPSSSVFFTNKLTVRFVLKIRLS